MRIAVLRDGGGWGDAVTCQPALVGLRDRHPDAEIDFVLPADLHGLFKLDPTGFRLVASPLEGRRHFNTHRTFDLTSYGLDPAAYDQVIDLWCPAWRYEEECRGDVRKSRIDNFCEEAGVPGRQPRLYPDPGEMERAAEIFGSGSPRVLIGWASANPSKDYPPNMWAEAARELMSRGARVAFVGKTLFPEGALGASSAMLLPAASLVAACAIADLVIGLDSGIAHIASALGRPTLWLFGPTNPIATLRYYPTAEWLARPDIEGCEWPCQYRRNRHYRCQGRPGDCLSMISPRAIARIGERMIYRSASGKAEAEDGAYQHWRRLGTDYAAYGSWHGAYREFLQRAFGIQGKRILDVGAACGAQLRAMLAGGADAFGAEPDHWMATHGVRGTEGRLWNCYVEALGGVEDFDMVHSHQVLEHVPEDRVPGHFAAFARHLKPGGIVYANLCLGGTPGCTRDKTHITLQPREWWAARAAEAGLEDASESFRGVVDSEPMQRSMKWDWFVWRKPEKESAK